jgi:hypothetical protein
MVEPHLTEANRAASTTPVLDALTRLGDLGIDLHSDGKSVWFAGDDWKRVPPDLYALVRQCGHELGKLLGNTRRKAAAGQAAARLLEN